MVQPQSQRHKRQPGCTTLTFPPLPVPVGSPPWIMKPRMFLWKIVLS